MERAPHVVDLRRDRQRFFDGLARQVGMSASDFESAGTTVCPRDDRAGTGAAACYRAGQHLVVWCDPALGPALAALARRTTLPPDDLAAALRSAGLASTTGAVIHCLTAPPTALPLADSRYRWQPLRADEPEHVARIRRFVGRSDPAEVESAGLDDIEEFDETAINVVTDAASGDPDEIVAYSSAMDWGWDAAFGDIAALVDPQHRSRGLARFVVARTCIALLEAGRIPLYRHEIGNAGSAAVAAAAGFAPVATMTYCRGG